MSAFQYFTDCITKNYVNFDGRARRSEYWYYTLFSIPLFIIASLLDRALGLNFSPLPYGYLYAAVGLGTFLPGLAVSIRRLHDVGKSGWMSLIVFIPLVGFIWLIVLACTDSTPGPNQYGPNPKGIGNSGADEQLINNIGN